MQEIVSRKTKSPLIQPKLQIGKPGDHFEQEADAIADRVVSQATPDPVVQMGPVGGNERVAMKTGEQTLSMQGDEEHVAMSPGNTDTVLMSENEALARKAEEQVLTKAEQQVLTKAEQVNRMPAIQKSSDGSTYASPSVAQQIQQTKGQGNHLGKTTQEEMGQKMDADFSGVKIHTDENAAALSESLGARAFTHGQDIYFNSGNYNPGTKEGKHLLAHELTHTIQQKGNGIYRKIQVPTGTNLIERTAYPRTGDLYTMSKPMKGGSLTTEIKTAMMASSRIFKLRGTSDATVTANLIRHIRARKNIIAFANAKKYGFAAGKNVKMNKAFWIQQADGRWVVRDDVSRQDAIQDLNIHPEEYEIACQSATELTIEGAGVTLSINIPSSDENDWVPGDSGYIKNNDFDGVVIGNEGENIIYMGNDLFWGHYNGTPLHPLHVWKANVASWNKGTSTLETTRNLPVDGLNT